MNKIIVVSTNNNPNYYFYAPYVKRAWNQLGWEVAVILTHDVDPNKIAGDYLIQLPEIEGIRLETLAQAGRLYAANHLPEDSLIMTSDMDLIPLSDYWKPEEASITVYGYDLTDYTSYPMGYIAMPSNKWKETLHLTGDTVSDFVRDAKLIGSPYSADWETWWTFDQTLITQRLESYKSQITFINRGRGQDSPYAYGRIDRGNGMQLIPKPWIDAHCDNGNIQGTEKLQKFLDLFNQVYPS